ncbi:hypothetical protein ACIBCR_27815 [Micromonospora echinospora]|uniref:hypothetical protein n=1 Tax=Micromonospora echinospora TaxID=1877 RepID=UPI0037981F3F
MSQALERHLKRRSTLCVLAAVVTVAGSLLASPSAAATPTEATPATEPTAYGVDTRPVGKTPAQLRAFWTPERLEAALRNPADARPVRAGDLTGQGTGNRRAAEVAPPTASAAAVPPAGATTARPPLSTQATVSVSQRVSNPAAWPTSAVGRLFYSNQAETEWYTCSGTSIVSTGGNAVWTAGHCLHQGSGGNSGWMANHVFIPAYGFNSNPYGWFFGVSIIAPSAWTDGADLEGSDVGALLVVPETGSNSLLTTVGGWGYQFNGATAYSNARSYGYPVIGYNRPASDFADGEYMMYCEGNTSDADNLNPFDDRLRLSCDMGGGASGGPLVINVGSSNIQIVGTNSHRNVDNNGNYNNNWLYSSNHGGTAASVINAVNNS